MNSTYLFNEQAEKSVISCFVHGDAKDFESFEPEDFFFDDVRACFVAARLLHTEGKHIDAVTLSDMVPKGAALELLVYAESAYYGSSAYPEHKKIVKELSALRKLIDLCDSIKDRVYSDDAARSEEIAADAEDALRKIQSEGYKRECSSLSELMPDFFSQMEKRSEKRGLPGISTGFSELDKATGGFMGGNLYVVGARPAMGKSAFASSLAIACAKKNKPVLFFSLEMGSSLVVQRMVAHELEISNSNLKLGKLSMPEWDRLADEGLNGFARLPVYIDDRGTLSADNITYSAMRLNNELLKKGEDRLSMVIVDYLQIMTGKDKDRRQVVEDNCRKLKLLARRLNIPVILLSQLNRATENGGDKRPTLSNLRETGGIEQDADTVMFLYRDEYYEKSKEKAENQRVEVIIAKQRDGALCTVKIDFYPEFTKFTEQGFIVKKDGKTWEQLTAE